jgi:uncharacterized protein with PIN domain|tara:strand:+ start:55 stop:324 length:270 start_codon:yes stop_codon:yes gene_type:complete
MDVILDSIKDVSNEYGIIAGIVFAGILFEILRRVISPRNKEIEEKKDVPPKLGYGCPSCYSEYLPEFDTCADCNKKLVDFSTLKIDSSG